MIIFMALRTHMQVSLGWAVRFNDLMYLCFFLGATGILIILLRERIKIGSNKILFFLLFIFHVLMVEGFHRDVENLPAIILTIGWLGFIVFLSGCRSFSVNIREVYYLLFYTCFLVIAYGLISYIYFGFDIDFFSYRRSGGYQNPLYYSQFVIVALFSYYMLLTLRGNESKKSGILASEYLVMAIAILLVALAAARSAFVAILIFAMLYYVRVAWAKIFLVAGVLLFGFISLDGVDLNQLSSGRLQLWSAHISHVLNEGLGSILFGVVEYPQTGVPTYGVLRGNEAITFRTYRGDNSFVEIFVKWGLLGSMLLAVGLWAAWRRSGFLPQHIQHIWRCTMWAILAHGLFVANLFSFFAPVPLFAIFFLTLPWLLTMDKNGGLNNQTRQFGT